MTTTNTYNPLLSAFRELTTPQAFRWYGTQAKATAALVQAIALHCLTTAQRLLSDRKPMAIAVVAEADVAIASHQESATAEAVYPVAIASQPAIAQPEATEAQDLPVPDGWEAIEANDTAVDEPEQADSCWEAIAPAQDMAIASAIEPEPEQAIAPAQTEAEAPAIAPEPDLSAAVADASEVDVALSCIDAVPLDDDDTELRPWAGDEAEAVESLVTSHQWEDDAEALAGVEAITPHPEYAHFSTAADGVAGVGVQD